MIVWYEVHGIFTIDVRVKIGRLGVGPVHREQLYRQKKRGERYKRIKELILNFIQKGTTEQPHNVKIKTLKTEINGYDASLKNK